ncbi:CBS domain-containing protein [Pseudobacteriovorax antillogorgiicola]|uniref:Acetoin utilization protein AcuB n=1 Tax=Pseudobacteriovorax antillogorgiicola TaxID=1513793 RepID=A0A1Y6BLV6_9BACT|nr:CBS domain-containing protein [Pseudobacteriovorax antillogorgiicola]TCS54701.1 acetoin utilization protein AcuB [Pseudobacteriovorax antillogorgiicola]SMF16306.1 acetoin utilization protein AcuB [Pseudobacteriovorax antillogorgiicola]
MKIKVFTVSPYDSISHAHNLMKQNNFRHLLVTDGGKLLGVISDRDIMQVADVDEHGVLHTPHKTIDDIMTANPVTISTKTTVAEMCKLMIDKHIDCLPVVEGDKIKGLVTSYDLLRLLSKIEDKHFQSFPFGFEMPDDDD